jgi:hypothetical protein
LEQKIVLDLRRRAKTLAIQNEGIDEGGRHPPLGKKIPIDKAVA